MMTDKFMEKFQKIFIWIMQKLMLKIRLNKLIFKTKKCINFVFLFLKFALFFFNLDQKKENKIINKFNRKY